MPDHNEHRHGLGKMKPPKIHQSRRLWLAGGLVATAMFFGAMFRGGESETVVSDPGNQASAARANRCEVTAIANDGEVMDLIKELEGLRERVEPVPDETRLQAERWLDDKKVPYRLRIKLALLAFGENDRWASKHIQIIFRSEISGKPFGTIAELFKLVPEGPIQIEVADVVAQAVSRTMTPEDASAAAAWVAGLPDGPRKIAVSSLGSCLASKGDLDSLRGLERSSELESVKSSFAWYRADLEKRNSDSRLGPGASLFGQRNADALA